VLHPPVIAKVEPALERWTCSRNTCSRALPSSLARHIARKRSRGDMRHLPHRCPTRAPRQVPAQVPAIFPSVAVDSTDVSPDIQQRRKCHLRQSPPAICWNRKNRPSDPEPCGPKADEKCTPKKGPQRAHKPTIPERNCDAMRERLHTCAVPQLMTVRTTPLFDTTCPFSRTSKSSFADGGVWCGRPWREIDSNV
jgi:hypothetical protein